MDHSHHMNPMPKHMDGRPYEWFVPAIGAHQVSHGVLMTVLVLGVLPYLLHHTLHGTRPMVRTGLAFSAFILALVSGAHMCIWQATGAGSSITLHGVGGWACLLLLGVYALMQHPRVVEGPKLGSPRARSLAAGAAFLGVLAVWFYGGYQALGIMEVEARQAGGHTIPCLGLLVLGGVYMFVDEPARIFRYQSYGIAAMGGLHLAAEVATGPLMGNYVGMSGLHHMIVAGSWVTAGLFQLVLTRKSARHKNFDHVAITLGGGAHMLMMGAHPNQDFGSHIHNWHTAFMGVMILFQYAGHYYLAGVFACLAGTVFVSSQAGLVVTMALLEVHYTVYLLGVIVATNVVLAWLSYLYIEDADPSGFSVGGLLNAAGGAASDSDDETP